MKTDVSISLGFVAVISSISLLLPLHASPNSWIGIHIYWIILLANSVFAVTSAVFTLQATRHIRQLGGHIGNMLKLFSVGLLFMGMAMVQVFFMNIFNLFTTPYFSSGIYWLPLFIGLICMVTALFGAAKTYARKAAAVIFFIVILCGLLRVALYFVPTSTVLFSTAAAFQRALTINTVLTAITSSLLALAILLRNSFGRSKIGNIFLLFIFAFFFVFLASIVGYHIIIISGHTSWFYKSGGYYLFILGASTMFYLFSIMLKHLDL